MRDYALCNWLALLPSNGINYDRVLLYSPYHVLPYHNMICSTSPKSPNHPVYSVYITWPALKRELLKRKRILLYFNFKYLRFIYVQAILVDIFLFHFMLNKHIRWIRQVALKVQTIRNFQHNAFCKLNEDPNWFEIDRKKRFVWRKWNTRKWQNEINSTEEYWPALTHPMTSLPFILNVEYQNKRFRLRRRPTGAEP